MHKFRYFSLFQHIFHPGDRKPRGMSLTVLYPIELVIILYFVYAYLYIFQGGRCDSDLMCSSHGLLGLNRAKKYF